MNCFCYGHSSDCSASKNHAALSIESSNDLNNLNEWSAVDLDNKNFFVGSDNQSGVFVFANQKDVWFKAPGTFNSRFISIDQKIDKFQTEFH
jgi:hypothetical protein